MLQTHHERGTSADITVAEGQTLVFTPALEKGTIYVRIMAPATDINKLPDVENDEAYFEGAFSGDAAGRVDVEPGEYSLFISTKEDKTTGTMTIVPQRTSHKFTVKFSEFFLNNNVKLA